jgi:hypothetical protein
MVSRFESLDGGRTAATQSVIRDLLTVIDFFIDLEGNITQLLSADTFEVNGQRVCFTNTTVFAGGTEANIAIGVAVEVEGRFDEEDVLVAAEIEFLSSP